MAEGPKRSAGFVLGWIWTLVAGGAGAAGLFHFGQALTGSALILSALAACPLISVLLERQGTRLGAGLRLGLALVFAGLAGLGIAQHPPATGLERPAAPAPVKTLLEDSGDFGNKATKVFTPPGKDWNLEWSFDCASLGDSGNFRLRVMRQGGGDSAMAAVERINDRDSSTEHYHQTGTFYLEVVSECRWNIKAVG